MPSLPYNRAYTCDISALAIYKYNKDPKIAVALNNLIGIYTNAKLNVKVDTTNARGTWEYWAYNIPVNAQMTIEIDALVDPTYNTNIRDFWELCYKYGFGPYMVMIKFDPKSPSIMAQAIVTSFSRNAPGEAQNQSIVLEVQGEPKEV